MNKLDAIKSMRETSPQRVDVGDGSHELVHARCFQLHHSYTVRVPFQSRTCTCRLGTMSRKIMGPAIEAPAIPLGRATRTSTL